MEWPSPRGVLYQGRSGHSPICRIAAAAARLCPCLAAGSAAVPPAAPPSPRQAEPFMRSRYDPDHPHHPHADAWPGERWLADWWGALTGARRWLAGAGAVLAVVAALVGLA